jgi:hypothetical protein
LVLVSFSRTTSTQIEFILKGWLFNKVFPRPVAGNDRAGGMLLLQAARRLLLRPACPERTTLPGGYFRRTPATGANPCALGGVGAGGPRETNCAEGARAHPYLRSHD